MFEVSIKTEFSAAHNLRGYQGKCEALHGHNWQVEVIVSSQKLDKIGIAIDFKKLKEVVNQVIEKLDHKYLNELPYFSAVGGSLPDRQAGTSGGKKVIPVRKKTAKDKSKLSSGVNPTSENMAKFIFDKIKPLLDKDAVSLKSVSVWENERSKAAYYE